MRMSPASRYGQKVGDGFVHDRRRNHQPDRARLVELLTKSCKRGAPSALSPEPTRSTAFGDMSKTTHWCPP